MTTCTHPQCRDDAGDCRAQCAENDRKDTALELAIKEAGFCRLAYDQLVARQEQEKQRLIGRLCMAVESESDKGYSESTVKHFRNLIISVSKGE